MIPGDGGAEIVVSVIARADHARPGPGSTTCTVSARAYDGVGVGDRTGNLTAWTAVLGDRRGTDDVSPHAAAARATDLSGLPPTFVVWGGAFHG
ncbi:hypothetical protein [Amycolatopsis sp. NBC_00438]|uniref:hypothetical protein n=1 Tax=Amycolatopsis sp. NBC_00438 TaxID=2903558 RepID=UPI002E21E8C6